MNISINDLDKLAMLPLRKDPRFNTFLSAYARMRSGGAGCRSCNKAKRGQITLDAATTAGAAFKAIAASDKTTLKRVIAAQYKISEKEPISFHLGSFRFQI